MIYYEISYRTDSGEDDIALKRDSEIKKVIEGKTPNPNDNEPDKRKKLTEMSKKTAMDVLDKFLDESEKEKAADLFANTPNVDPKHFAQAAKQLVQPGKYESFLGALKNVIDPEDKFSAQDLFEDAATTTHSLFNKENFKPQDRVKIGPNPTAGATFRGQKGVVTKAEPNLNFMYIRLDAGYERAFYTKDVEKLPEAVQEEVAVATPVVNHLENAIAALNQAKLEKGFLGQFEPGLKKAVEIIAALKDKHLGAKKEEGVVPNEPDDSSETMKDLLELHGRGPWASIDGASVEVMKSEIDKDGKLDERKLMSRIEAALKAGGVFFRGWDRVKLEEGKVPGTPDDSEGTMKDLLEAHPGIQAVETMVDEIIRIARKIEPIPIDAQGGSLLRDEDHKIIAQAEGIKKTLKNLGHLGESVDEAIHKLALITELKRIVGMLKSVEDAHVGVALNKLIAELEKVSEGVVPGTPDDSIKTMEDLLECNVLDMTTMKMVMTKESLLRVFTIKEAATFIAADLKGLGRIMEMGIEEAYRDDEFADKIYESEPEEVGAPKWVKSDEDKATWGKAVAKAREKNVLMKDGKVNYGALVALWKAIKNKEARKQNDREVADSVKRD
jgi:hypothetical protein